MDFYEIFVKKHKALICSKFSGETKFKDIRVLDIPDDYNYMDEELIEILESAIEL